MKLKIPFKEIAKKQADPPEIYLSLLLGSDAVAGSCWHLDIKKKPYLLHAVARKLDEDSWEARTYASDQVISALEERVGSANIHKVVFGLPAYFLSADGAISPSVRQELKTLKTKLELTPIGYVPAHQAIAFRLKDDEGVPASVIILEHTRWSVTVTLYKVGVLAGQTICPNDERIILRVEEALRSYTSADVLPARMLIHGSDQTAVMEFKADLTRHPWPSKANFIHFPKIEALPPDYGITSISYAGASELAGMLPIGGASGQQTLQEHANEVKEESVPASALAVPDDRRDEPEAGDATDSQEASDIPDDEDLLVDTPPTAQTGSRNVSEEDGYPDEVQNVRFVSPESVGFRRNEDILESLPVKDGRHEDDAGASSEEDVPSPSTRVTQPRERPLPRISVLPKSSFAVLFSRIRGFVQGRMRLSTKKSLAVPLIILACFAGMAGVYYLGAVVLPRASVEIAVKQMEIPASDTVRIDTKADGVDGEGNTIPGISIEQSVSGEKSIQTSGKKQVGDPAKGTITVYNKSLTSRTIRKGTVVSSKGVDFTLDEDATVPAATESIGSITFGKADASVTAASIGEEGNLAADNEFSFEDIADSVAIARNAQAFAGGTSRDIRVVSRADQDALVQAITPELVEKAKAELAGGVTGSRKLIESTITTSVSSRTFDQEVDEESDVLAGTVTVVVSGVTYDEADMNSLVFSWLDAKLPEGYALSEESPVITLSEPETGKDNAITASVEAVAKASPLLDTVALSGSVTGMSTAEARERLKSQPGVSDVTISVVSSWFSKNLPKNANHINITVKSVQ